MTHFPGWSNPYGDHDDDYDDFYADVENMEEHYADEINGNAVYPEPEPEYLDGFGAPSVTNAPGQLRLNFGAALR